MKTLFLFLAGLTCLFPPAAQAQTNEVAESIWNLIEVDGSGHPISSGTRYNLSFYWGSDTEPGIHSLSFSRFSNAPDCHGGSACTGYSSGEIHTSHFAKSENDCGSTKYSLDGLSWDASSATFSLTVWDHRSGHCGRSSDRAVEVNFVSQGRRRYFYGLYGTP